VSFAAGGGLVVGFSGQGQGKGRRVVGGIKSGKVRSSSPGTQLRTSFLSSARRRPTDSRLCDVTGRAPRENSEGGTGCRGVEGWWTVAGYSPGRSEATSLLCKAGWDGPMHRV